MNLLIGFEFKKLRKILPHNRHSQLLHGAKITKQYAERCRRMDTLKQQGGTSPRRMLTTETEKPKACWTILGFGKDDGYEFLHLCPLLY